MKRKKSKKRKSRPVKSTSLKKLGSKGFRGYPIATVALYGPNNKLATKVTVGIVPDDSDDSENIDLKKWYSENEDTDIRSDRLIEMEILEYIKDSKARSVVISDGIMGCPHEEVIDYPEGSICPKCSFWANRDRFSGEIMQ